MSISTLRKPSNGRHIVPLWFKDILHAIIYSDCVQAYTAIHAIALFLGAETHDRRILALHAHGLNHTQIAARLKVSRYSIIRAMNRLLKLAYSDTLERMQKSPMAADILDKFLARNYTHTENIHTAIAFLNGFTCTELGVLSALLRELPESEAIEYACVSKSRYHTVKKRLLELLDFEWKSAPKKVQKKIPFGHCVKRTDMIPFAAWTKKCTFPSTLRDLSCINRAIFRHYWRLCFHQKGRSMQNQPETCILAWFQG